MTEGNVPPIVMQCGASYALAEDGGRLLARGESTVLLDSEKLTVLPASGDPLVVSYRDISGMRMGDYRIDLNLISKEKLTFSNLGSKFEDFVRNLTNLNNEVVLKDPLMNETLLKSGFEADWACTDDGGVETKKGQCELRVYETGLVIIGQDGSFTRVPYGYVAQVRVQDYRLVVNAEYGQSYAFSRMGRSLDECYRMISNSINELSTKTQLQLKEIFPSRDPALIRTVARLMKDGRAARRANRGGSARYVGGIGEEAGAVWHQGRVRILEISVTSRADVYWRQEGPDG